MSAPPLSLRPRQSMQATDSMQPIGSSEPYGITEQLRDDDQTGEARCAVCHVIGRRTRRAVT